jgi:Ca-activated chloride channel family protein
MPEEDVIHITDEEIEATPPQPQKQQEVIVINETDLIGQSDYMMGPKPASKQSVDIILLIDTSGSMGADDYPPNRLAAAKEAAKMFTKRKVVQNYNDRVGVIGFGGSAKVVHPLDPNLDKVAVSVDKLKMTHSGSMIGTALQAALRELNRYKSKRRAVVLLSDGADKYDSSNPVKVASNMQGIKVFTIGIGTVKGGMAVLPHGKQKVYLNEKVLRQIAEATGGEYLYAPDVPELQQIYLRLADY